MAINVLIINDDLRFAVNIKQAMELTGVYSVFPFTEPEFALTFLQENPQDVAVIDMTQGIEIVEEVRSIQPDILVIVSPKVNNPAVIKRLGLSGSLDMPFLARDLIVMLDDLLESVELEPDEFEPPQPMFGADDETAYMPPTPPRRGKPEPPDDMPEFSSLEGVLSEIGTNELFEPPVDDEDTPTVPQDQSDAIRQFLATGSLSDEQFRDVLSEIDTDSLTERDDNESNFSRLVNSMKTDELQPPLPDRHRQFIEFILADDPITPSREKPRPPEIVPEEESQTFQRLAQEEPPMPDFEESGTVSDLMVGVSDSSFERVLSLMRGEEVEDEEFDEYDAEYFRATGTLTPPETLPEEADQPDEFDEFRDFGEFAGVDDTDSAPPIAQLDDDSQESMGTTIAQLILQAALDETTPIEALKVEEAFLSTIVQTPPNLPEVAQEGTTADLINQPTRPSDEEAFRIRRDRSDEDTDAIRTSEMWHTPLPPDFLPELDEATTPSQETERKEVEPEPEPDEERPERLGWVAVERPLERFDEGDDDDATTTAHVPVGVEPEGVTAAPAMLDPESEIAQLALNLTQASLESTAEASVLTRGDRIIAAAGDLSADEIAELQQVIEEQWDTDAGGARLRFITMPSSGTEYMMYSRQSDDGYTLTMVFAGGMPLRAIRRQGDRLVKALQSVPDVPEETAVTPSPDDVMDERILETLDVEDEESARMVIQEAAKIELGPVSPYTFVWLLRDPNAELGETTRGAIDSGLRIQLEEVSWSIDQLDVQADYVYLLAGIPGERHIPDVVRDLKRRSAEIARLQNPSLDVNDLWAESYLMVTPGRELDVEEVQQFINFERML